MSKTIDYYLSVISPWAYLGSQRLEAIAARHGAEIKTMPVSFAVVFPRTGGLPLPKRAPERQAYRMMELKRWRSHLDLPLTLQLKHFPIDESLAARMVVAAEQAEGSGLALAHRLLRATWAEERSIAEPETLKALATELGLDGEALLTAAETPEVAEAYAAQTEAAIARGVFGAPTYVYRDELFWGQDRLEFLDRALAAS